MTAIADEAPLVLSPEFNLGDAVRVDGYYMLQSNSSEQAPDDSAEWRHDPTDSWAGWVIRCANLEDREGLVPTLVNNDDPYSKAMVEYLSTKPYSNVGPRVAHLYPVLYHGQALFKKYVVSKAPTE